MKAPLMKEWKKEGKDGEEWRKEMFEGYQISGWSNYRGEEETGK